jgi:hypothetical protein
MIRLVGEGGGKKGGGLDWGFVSLLFEPCAEEEEEYEEYEEKRTTKRTTTQGPIRSYDNADTYAQHRLTDRD